MCASGIIVWFLCLLGSFLSDYLSLFLSHTYIYNWDILQFKCAPSVWPPRSTYKRAQQVDACVRTPTQFGRPGYLRETTLLSESEWVSDSVYLSREISDWTFFTPGGWYAHKVVHTHTMKNASHIIDHFTIALSLIDYHQKQAFFHHSKDQSLSISVSVRLSVWLPILKILSLLVVCELWNHGSSRASAYLSSLHAKRLAGTLCNCFARAFGSHNIKILSDWLVDNRIH